MPTISACRRCSPPTRLFKSSLPRPFVFFALQISILVFKKELWGRYYIRLILYVALCDWISVFPFMLGREKSGSFVCALQGLCSNFFGTLYQVLMNIFLFETLSLLHFNFQLWRPYFGRRIWHTLSTQSWCITLYSSKVWWPRRWSGDCQLS